MDVKSVSYSKPQPPTQAKAVQEPTPEQKKERARQEQPRPTTESVKKPVVNTQGQTTGRLVNTTA